VCDKSAAKKTAVLLTFCVLQLFIAMTGVFCTGFPLIRGKILATRPHDYCNATKLMDWWPFAVAAVCAGMLMPLAMHSRAVGREAHGVQQLHDVPTSRLGGIVVVVACAVTLALVLAAAGTWTTQGSR
jgi:hypothetical protein